MKSKTHLDLAICGGDMQSRQPAAAFAQLQNTWVSFHHGSDKPQVPILHSSKDSILTRLSAAQALTHLPQLSYRYRIWKVAWEVSFSRATFQRRRAATGWVWWGSSGDSSAAVD